LNVIVESSKLVSLEVRSVTNCYAKYLRLTLFRLLAPLYRNNDIIQQPIDLPTLTQQYNAEIMSYLDRAANSTKPFFLYIAHDQVHVQLYASDNFLGKSRRGLYGDAAEEMDDSVGQVRALLIGLYF